MLRDKIFKLSAFTSDTVYCRGFAKRFTDNEVEQILSTVEPPIEMDFSRRHRYGIVWAKYRHTFVAHETIMALHQTIHNGISLSVRFELGLDEQGKQIIPKSSHSTLVRCVLHNGQPFCDVALSMSSDAKYCGQCVDDCIRTKKNTPSIPNINYTHKSVFVGDFELPFPSGTYLSKLIGITRSYPFDNPLVTLLTDVSLSKHSNKYAKEITEVMAMVDAVERCIKLALNVHSSEILSAVLYVLGDGQTPLCAAALCLNFPDTWTLFSIDPILVPIDVTAKYSVRFNQIPTKSEEFRIPDTKSSLSIVVACHSHAPLQEFWDRVSTPKLCVTMPCCAHYSDLHAASIFEFDDFEVYSPKRRIKLFALL